MGMVIVHIMERGGLYFLVQRGMWPWQVNCDMRCNDATFRTTFELYALLLVYFVISG